MTVNWFKKTRNGLQSLSCVPSTVAEGAALGRKSLSQSLSLSVSQSLSSLSLFFSLQFQIANISNQLCRPLKLLLPLSACSLHVKYHIKP